jgi:hypothetical protein
MRKLAALSAVLLATACGQASVADQYRDALPAAREVAVGAPVAGQASTALSDAAPLGRVAGAPGTALGVVRSEYATTSYVFAASINTSVAWTLFRLHAVTLWPPTSCDDASCTWGPGSDAGDVNDWRLVVTKVATGTFDYDLQGRPKAGGAWTSVISGTANPGAERFRGHGTMVVDFDGAWSGLAHGVNLDGSPKVQEDFGRLEVAYDARSILQVQAAFVGAKDAEKFAADPAARVDAWYDFQAADPAGAAGDLHLAFRTLTVGQEESVSLHTRWAVGGAGRGDVVAQSYKYPGATYQASECWAGAALGHVLTYDTDPAIGLESACAGFLTAAPLEFPSPFPPALP